MKTVKIPESFGSGDVTITINGAVTKIPIGIETEVKNAVAEIVEKMIRDRTLEGLTEEEIKAKELEKLGAAGVETVKALEGKMNDLANNPCIKTLWTGCCQEGTKLTIEIPEEMLYNDGKSLIVMIQVWDGNSSKMYGDNRPIIYGFSFGEGLLDESASGYTPGTRDTEGNYIANFGECDKNLASEGVKLYGDIRVTKDNTGKIKLYYRNSSPRITTTAISVLRGDM